MSDKPDDFSLPNAVVLRLMKEALPEGATISKNARVAIRKAASIFILYLSSFANISAMGAKRKTIMANDILTALKETELESFIDPLTEVLEEIRSEKASRSEQTHRAKKRKLPETEIETIEELAEQPNEFEDATMNEIAHETENTLDMLLEQISSNLNE